MAGITLAQAEAQLALWLAASEKITAGQSVTIGDHTYRQADAAAVQQQIIFWDRQVKRLSRGGIKVNFGTPC